MRRSLKVSYGRLHPFVLEQTVLAADTLKRRAGLFRGQPVCYIRTFRSTVYTDFPPSEYGL